MKLKKLPTVLIINLFTYMGIATAGPITFNSALPISEGVGILRSQVKLIQKTRDETVLNRNLAVQVVPLVLVYGISAKLTLFGVLPYVTKRMDITMGTKRVHRQTEGLGDGKLFARYTLYQADDLGDTLRIAPFIGLKLPTGDYDKRDTLGVLPRQLQSGSASWDPFVGIAITRQTLDWEFDTAIRYQTNTEAAKFKFGNEVRFDTSFQYRVLPRTLGATGVPSFIYAVLESSLIWNGKNKQAGASDLNSGGNTWNLVPGLQYVTRRYVLETAVQVPVMQKLNGTAQKTDWVWTAGFRQNF